MKHRTFLGKLLGVALFAAVAAASGAAGVASAQNIPIRIGAATATDHAAAFVGIERGIFAKHGLDARLVMYQTGIEMINGMLANAQDVSILGSIPFLSGVSNGQPLVLIGHLHGDALASSYSQNNSIVATPASGIKAGDVHSLAGKRIGLPRGSGAEGYLLGILASNNMRPTDVTLVNVAPSNSVTALRQNDVDAIAGFEPWGTVSAMRVPNAFQVIRGQCPKCYDPGTIVTTRSAIANKSEALRRFMVAFAEATQIVRSDPAAAAEVDTRWIPGIDIDVLKRSVQQSNFDIRLSRNTIDGYNATTIPGLVKDKRMARSVEASTIVDPQFYDFVERTAPQFFSDLPPIPKDKRL